MSKQRVPRSTMTKRNNYRRRGSCQTIPSPQFHSQLVYKVFFVYFCFHRHFVRVVVDATTVTSNHLQQHFQSTLNIRGGGKGSRSNKITRSKMRNRNEYSYLDGSDVLNSRGNSQYSNTEYDVPFLFVNQDDMDEEEKIISALFHDHEAEKSESGLSCDEYEYDEDYTYSRELGDSDNDSEAFFKISKSSPLVENRIPSQPAKHRQQRKEKSDRASVPSKRSPIDNADLTHNSSYKKSPSGVNTNSKIRRTSLAAMSSSSTTRPEKEYSYSAKKRHNQHLNKDTRRSRSNITDLQTSKLSSPTESSANLPKNSSASLPQKELNSLRTTETLLQSLRPSTSTSTISKNRDVSSTPTSTRYLQREHTSSKTNGYTRSAFRSRIPSETSKSVQQTARPPPSERVPPTKSTKTLPTTMSLTTPWARKFIMSRPKDALLPIPREFLSDGFNLVRVAPIVDRTVANTVAAERDEGGRSSKSNGHISLYKAALRLILDEESPALSRGSNNSSTPGSSKRNLSQEHHQYSPEQVQKAAEVIYTLVHARYITSPRGLDTVRRMFRQGKSNPTDANAIFGRCTRINCQGMPLLPLGVSDAYDEEGNMGIKRKAMRYCSSCGEAFYVWDSKIDGSAWGPSFCHLFLMAHGNQVFPSLTDYDKKQHNREECKRFMRPQKDISKNRPSYLRAMKLNEKGGEDQDEDISRPIPRIFGFRIHPCASIRYPIL